MSMENREDHVAFFKPETVVLLELIYHRSCENPTKTYQKPPYKNLTRSVMMVNPYVQPEVNHGESLSYHDKSMVNPWFPDFLRRLDSAPPPHRYQAPTAHSCSSSTGSPGWSLGSLQNMAGCFSMWQGNTGDVQVLTTENTGNIASTNVCLNKNGSREWLPHTSQGNAGFFCFDTHWGTSHPNDSSQN